MSGRGAPSNGEAGTYDGECTRATSILLKRVIVEMFLGRKSSHVQMVRQLDQDIVDSEPSHAFQRILVALGASHRAHQVEASQHVAKLSLEILSKRSIPQLKLTFLSYAQIYGHSDSKWLKGRNNSEFENALRMVFKCVVNLSQYYAELLNASIKEAILRVMASK